jgi:hypothetical protein
VNIDRGRGAIKPNFEGYVLMSDDNLHALLKLYRARLEVTQEVMRHLQAIPSTEVEGALFEVQKWTVRQGQERHMIERLEQRLGISRKPDPDELP